MLSLLIPFVVYNLTLKALDVASRPNEPGLALTLDLMRSDILFDLGYAALWIALFALAHKGPLRWTVVFLFHTATLLVAIVSTLAHHYLHETGMTLGYGIIALWLPKFGEVKPILVQVVPLSGWIVLSAVLFYATFGPWLVTRGIEGWRRRPWASLSERPEISFLGPLGIFLLAFGFGSLSVLVGSNPAAASTALARDPFINVILTGIREASAEKADREAVAEGSATEPLATDANLLQTPRTEKRNVVLIHLESTRERSVTPYTPELGTTPFLDELAKSSLFAQRAYTTVPHTSKATTSVNCGIFPHVSEQNTEAEPGGIPVPCLPELLKGQGYDTVFFQSPTEDFEDRRDLVENLGYEEFYPLEAMDKESFEQTNYFGHEDDVMLEPSEEWLEEREDKPFVAKYLTGTGHHDYRCLSTRHGSEDFSDDGWANRYLNCLRLQDIFVENLFEQYEELGLYQDTIFVLYGDHGEALGEHGRYQHNDTIWEEGLRVPLLVHAPGSFEGGARVEGLANLTDILPTVLEMLGYEVENGEYPGYSLLRPLPEDRTLMFSCFHDNQCLASIQGYDKFIHHYANWPDEIFDLSEDPLEEQNLVGERGNEVDKRREKLFAWHSEAKALYAER